MRIFSTKVHAGEPLKAGDTEVTPVARSFTLRLPGPGARLVRIMRPAAVAVSSGGGPVRMLKVTDRSRRMQLAAAAVPLSAALLIRKMVMLKSRRR